jgi:hypothetical protein
MRSRGQLIFEARRAPKSRVISEGLDTIFAPYFTTKLKGMALVST